MPYLSTAIYRLSIVSSLFIFFVFPSIRFQTLLPEGSLKYYYPLMFLSLLTCVTAYCLQKIFANSTPSYNTGNKNLHPFGAAKKSSRWLRVLKYLLSLYILFWSFSHLSYPPNADEKDVVAEFSNFSYVGWLSAREINLRFHGSKNQFVAILTTLLSSQVFGLNGVAISLPAFFFTLIFLLMLYRFSEKHLSPIVSLLVYGQLCVNYNFMWFTHSSKGYISAMVFGLWILMALSHVYSKKSRYALLNFAMAFYLAPFTHTFSAIYCGLVLICLVFWAYLNRQNLDSHSIEVTKKLILIGMFGIPIILFVAYNHWDFVTQVKNIFNPSENGVSFLGYFSGLLGSPRVWWAKSLLIISGVGLFLQWKNRYRLNNSFFEVFVPFSFLFFVLFVITFKVGFFRPRFFLIFLIPLLVWLGDLIYAYGNSRLALAGLVLAILWVSPLIYFQNGTYHTSSARDREVEFFFSNVKRLTVHTKTHCYRVEGHPVEEKWIQHYYLSQEHTPQCKQEYYISLRRGTDRSQLPAPKGAKLLFQDHRGRALYLL